MSNDNSKSVDEESKKTSKSTNKTDAQTAPATINPSEPEPESVLMSYMGIDSSAVNDYTILDVDEGDEQKAVMAWIEQINNPKKGQKISAIIMDGIKLAQDMSKDANMLINEANKNFADRAIAIGQICIKLKELIRGGKELWGAWAEKNLSFIAKRNREKYMLLASRPDCWPFSFLGVDRLETLCSVTKEMKGKDRIGKLLKKYKIPFDNEIEVNMADFKVMIDGAISHERLENNGLKIKLSLVIDGINNGVVFDKSMIKRLKDVQDCGGTAETLLKKLVLTGGKEDMDVTPEKRLQDFNHLSNRLIKTLEFIIDDQDQLIKIDRETFQLLLEKLVSIKDSVILNDDAEEAE